MNKFELFGTGKSINVNVGQGRGYKCGGYMLRLRRTGYDKPVGYIKTGIDGTHGYRTHLANLLSTLAHSTGSVSDVTVVLDGGKFPPKAAEHARRDSASTSRKEGSSLPADVLPLLWKVITPHHFRFTRANLSCIRPA